MKVENQLLLSTDISSWGIVSQEHGSLLEAADPSILEIYRHVMQRDNYSCYYCGFQSDKYQEVHHLDHNHSNNDTSNLVTVCPLCHQNHHLSLADLHNGAVLIWCPDLTQQEINDFCRMTFILNQISETSNKGEGHYISRGGFAGIYIDILEKGVSSLETMFAGASNCGTFGQVLLDIKQNKPDLYLERDKWIKNIKMLHRPMRFYVQTAYWRKMMSSVPNLRVDKWVDYTIFKDQKDKPAYTEPTAEEVKTAFELDLSKLL